MPRRMQIDRPLIQRAIGVDERLWREFVDRAAEHGGASAVLRELMREWVGK